MHGTQIRLRSIESFNKEYQTNYKLKPKLKGRNKDYHITEMDNYQQMKNNIEIHQRNLKLIEEKNNNLSNKTKEIEEISDLKKENLNLKSLLQKLKDKFYFIKHFIFNKLIDHKEKDKYVQLTHDLYEHRGLDEDDYKELINFSKPINSSRDYIAKEKDDYER